jgi:NTE family protein
MPLQCLVLGGGNALGAYLAGAYEGLHSAGQEPNWIAGSSIGAITAALIAGNLPERRMERLRAFWRAATSPAWLPWARGEQWLAAVQSRLLGRPALFLPRLPSLMGQPDKLGIYDHAPTRRLLLDLIDFDHLNVSPIRVSVLAVDLQSGQDAVFDTRQRRLTVDHLMASAALIPDFPPVCVDGRWLVDGGLAANVPADLVLANRPDQDTTCILVDPFPAKAPLPDSLPMLSMRQTDLTFARQTERTLRTITALAKTWPANGTCVDLARIAYGATPNETAMKSWDFSEAALTRRWDAGRRDMGDALAYLRQLPARRPGLYLHSPLSCGRAAVQTG